MTQILKHSCLAMAVGLGVSSGVLAQSQTDKERAAQQAIKAVHARDLPEATLPCTPEESSWWNEVRAVAKVINPARPNKPETEKLTRLIKKAIEQAYQIPVPDRYATVLWRAAPLTGQDNHYVYRELLGISADEYDALVATGHIGDRYL